MLSLLDCRLFFMWRKKKDLFGQVIMQGIDPVKAQDIACDGYKMRPPVCHCLPLPSYRLITLC